MVGFDSNRRRLALAILLLGGGGCSQASPQATAQSDAPVTAATSRSQSMAMSGSPNGASKSLTPGEGAASPAPAKGAAPAQSGSDRAEDRARSLRSELPASFTVTSLGPFVIVGNEAPADVLGRRTRTVAWALERLRAQFFDTVPTTPVEVWLLKDASSYEHVSLVRFGIDPSTPYGFYDPSQRVLLMNISTGGGTLVHELVHPLVEADFPDCPAWFNEALGSLYEQSADRDGHIVGLVNWRLPALRAAIEQDRAVPLARLTSQGDAFYDDDTGVYYASARYLAMYLQEQGLLETYYERFRAAAAGDPTGLRTLTALVEESRSGEAMDDFERSFHRFAMGLPLP